MEIFMSRRILPILLCLLAFGLSRASYPITWGTYGNHAEKGYLHNWGDEWLDFSPDSLAIQVKTWPVRYRTLAWVDWQGDTLRAPINRIRLDSFVQSKGGILPFREAPRSKPVVEMAPVDPDVMPKGIAAAVGGAILLGVGGQYSYHCNEPLCQESTTKQLIAGGAFAGGVALLSLGVWWIVEAVRNAR
jgi:hypothetical protein